MKGGGIRVFQLPVIVTAAETVGPAVHQGDGKKEEKMPVMPPVPKATTIAAGDDDENQVRHNRCNVETTDHPTASDDHPTTTTTLDHNDSKLKRMLPFMMQSLKELLISLSCSLLLKFVFGGLCGIRTFCLVHFCNFFLSCQSTTEQVVAGQWIPSLWQHFNTAVVESSTMTLTTIEKGLSHHHYYRESSWPPPTLLALGLFTIGTLIVHPDGYTWIVIHRIRDAAYFAMQSSTTCWAIAVNDYGAILSSILAMSTFATLFFFVYVLHRTLKSRTVKDQHHQQNHKQSEKHKKKKRKHTRNGQKCTGRMRSANDIDQGQDQILHNADSTNEVLILHSSDHRVLPPLAEDEPLESPPPTGSLLAETLASISKYESPQSHLTISRSRTASSSTVDSVACSLDDQSSCSGRSTPTPISVNESLHPHFVTTLVKPSTSNTNASVRGNNGGQLKSLNATPTPPLSQTPRRNQNNRRSGKKSSSQPSEEVPVATVTNQSPPLTPSKRWDALKPTNRSNTTRQQQRQPLSNRPGRNETIKSRVVPSVKSDHEPRPTTDMAHECKTQSVTLTEDINRALDSTDCSIPYMGIHLAGATVDTTSLLDESLRNNQNEYSFGLVSDDRISCSGLNPNSNTWTGTMNVVPKDQTNTSPSSAFHGYDNVFGLNMPRLQNAPSLFAEDPSPHYPVPHGGDHPPNQHYYFNSSERVETTVQTTSTPGGRPTPPFGLSLLQGSTINTVQHGHHTTDTAAAAPSLRFSPPMIDSTMAMALTTTHGSTTTSPLIATGQPHYYYYHHHHRSHAVVRDNPFATSDDDDDQMIEAKLLELGGQMVGSILDF